MQIFRLIADWRRVWEPAGNAAAGSVAPANNQPQIGVLCVHIVLVTMLQAWKLAVRTVDGTPQELTGVHCQACGNITTNCGPLEPTAIRPYSRNQ